LLIPILFGDQGGARLKVSRTGEELNRTVSSEADLISLKPRTGNNISEMLCPTTAGRTGGRLKNRFFLRGKEAIRTTAGSKSGI
jgi:hypothetical protein